MTDAQVSPAPPSPPPGPVILPNGRGRAALIMAIVVASLSVLASVAIGLFATTIYHYKETITSGGHSLDQYGFNISPASVPAGLQGLFGSIVGIIALIYGIVAVVQNRGRREGIIAIIIAASAPIVSVIIFGIVGGIAGHNVYNY